MNLSSWQRLMLREAAKAKPRVHRRLFEQEYKRLNPEASQKEVMDMVTKTMERLIDRGLAIGYGYKTQYKLFLTTLNLTPAGRKVAKEISKKQILLPLFKKASGSGKK